MIKTNVCNFARVFEIPTTKQVGKHEYCFGGGYQYPVKLVDFFNPFPRDKAEISEEEITSMLKKYIAEKGYIDKTKHYIVVCDNGLVVSIPTEANKKELESCHVCIGSETVKHWKTEELIPCPVCKGE